MKTSFETLKNGKNAIAVFANPTTKEIVIANKNAFGYNVETKKDTDFDLKYGKNLKTTQGRSDFRRFFYSEKSMNSVGFQIVKRSENPLW